MLGACIPVLMTILVLVLCVKSLQDLENSILGIRALWIGDYDQAFCARLSAMEANLKSARRLIEQSSPKVELEGLDDNVVSMWRQAYEDPGLGFCKGTKGDGYRLMQQSNRELPEGYPNWWVQWLGDHAEVWDEGPAELEAEGR